MLIIRRYRPLPYVDVGATCGAFERGREHEIGIVVAATLRSILYRPLIEQMPQANSVPSAIVGKLSIREPHTFVNHKWIEHLHTRIKKHAMLDVKEEIRG